MNLRPAYALAFLSLLVGVPMLTFGPWWAGLSVLATAGLVLRREFRVDQLVASIFTSLVLGLLAAVYLAIFVIMGFDGQWVMLLVLLLLVASTIGALVSWSKARKFPQGLPDILGSEFGQDALLETDEVQWLVVTPSDWLSADSRVDIWLQSCVDSPRRCRLSFEEESRKPLGDGCLLYPAPFDVDLAPGDVVCCSVPVRPTERHADEVRFFVRVEAKGSVATRNRKFRGHPVDERVSTTKQVVGLALGMIIWGGGVYVTFQRRRDQPASYGDDSLAATWEVKWSQSAVAESQ